ncbi:heat stress transcription factor B-2b-like [Zingiber officinale]|uniref:heat stress transcription factor B-2b-like n=1 Tax=Zingiber officinale TaxID=94328 RepID=UPI001C4D4E15|nr:heat stress transcription factor B-2b-like [Zingiber officinale]
MARPSAESSPTTEEGGPPLSAHEQGHRSTPTPFLTKTYQLVDEPSIDDVISWNMDGTTFVVWRPAEFASEVLPKYFKHNNFSSFVRQLNTYGFRKIVPDRWEFANDFFRRGEKRLLCEIHRRKISSAPSSTAAPPASQAIPGESPVNSGEERVITTIPLTGGAQPAEESRGATTELVEENDRLRRENTSLCRELSQMKNLCNNILNLMSKYAPSCRHNVAANIGGGPTTTASPPDLAMSSPMEQDDSDEEETAAPPPPPPPGKKVCSTTTRLFGVSIGFKRNRVESGASSKSEAEVKREPMDLDGGRES